MRITSCRGYQYDEPLRELGVEMRHLSAVEFKPAEGWEGKDALEAFKAGKMTIDTSVIEWADVIVFRRYYNTTMKCAGKEPCNFVTHDIGEAYQHEHGYRRQDDITRHIWPAFRDHWTGGIVYETDDDHFNIQPWNGYYGDVVRERDLIVDMAKRADLLTAATPRLADRYSRFNKNVRVVRNAIDPDLYIKDTPRPEGDLPRLVYYGSTARLRDYAGRFATGKKADGGGYAFQAVQAHRDRLVRVFLGTNPGSEDTIAQLFDEQTPYIEGIAKFSKALANSHGDIGIAPLGGDDFDAAKSELHWLEYAITDMAFIGERYRGEGPYTPVRDGVDGLLVRGAQEWHDAVKKLATSPGLRADLAGAAKERVLREYDYRDRAREWADAFRWAAEHARGALSDRAA